MALINCEECNKEVSDKAKNCVHCGAPIKINKDYTGFLGSNPQKYNKKSFYIVGLLVILMGVYIGNLNRTKSAYCDGESTISALKEGFSQGGVDIISIDNISTLSTDSSGKNICKANFSAPGYENTEMKYSSQRMVNKDGKVGTYVEFIE